MDTNLNNQNDSGEEAVPAKKDGNGKETSLDNINDNDEKIILNKGNDNVRKNVLGRKRQEFSRNFCCNSTNNTYICDSFGNRLFTYKERLFSRQR